MCAVHSNSKHQFIEVNSISSYVNSFKFGRWLLTDWSLITGRGGGGFKTRGGQVKKSGGRTKF